MTETEIINIEKVTSTMKDIMELEERSETMEFLKFEIEHSSRHMQTIIDSRGTEKVS